MDDLALRLAIGDLNAAYADCIDDDRLEDWPDFFVENCRYLITDRQSHEAGLRHGDSQLFATGRYLDKIAVAEVPFRFVERLVILDSRKVDTLLVLPL